jgi:hypothetical protein
MSVECRGRDRRSAQRYASPGKLWWMSERGENFSPAWTSDVSHNGLAFVTSRAEQLRHGDEISVSRTHPRRSGAALETLRVARIAPYGPNLDLVGCRRVV